MTPLKVDNTIFSNIIEAIRRIRSPCNQTNHYAILVEKNNFAYDTHVAISSNYIPCKHIPGMKSVHAEDGCLNKFIHSKKYKKNKKIKYDLIVIRMSRIGNIGTSRPCFGCIIKMCIYKIVYKINICNVYYSHIDGLFRKEHFDDMYDSKLNKFSAGDNRRKIYL